jgi:chorismate lyase/3-hydroxybenzoate synthase
VQVHSDIPRLRVQRLPLAACAASASAMEGALPFAALGYGTQAQAHATPAWAPHVEARLLSTPGPMADLWQTSAPAVESGSTGCVHWRSDGHWLFGAIDLDEAAQAQQQGLGELAHHAYRDLFATLDAFGPAQLLRVWNYLPHINADGGGLERYRQFNLGRQQAFLEAGRAAFEGAPAACALGVRQGGLSIRFLAGRSAPQPIENPRQVSAYRYPESYGPRSPTFSRAALAELGGGATALFISGTASIVGHTSLHAGDVHEQTRETLRNLEVLIAAANQRTDAAPFSLAALDCVVYVRHAADAPAVRQVIDAVIGAETPMAQHAVYLEADVCRSELLVEIEGHALACGGLRA